MTDEEIISLYFQRNEQAIEESKVKYGSYCFAIADRILGNREDSEECVSDTMLKVWNAVPPQYPSCLPAFLAKITRNLAINKYKSKMTAKRGKDTVTVALYELQECIASDKNVETEVLKKDLSECINRFLINISERDRNIFIRRYFYMHSTAEIAMHYGMKESNVLMNLSRTRKKLRMYLMKEWYADE